MKYFKKVVFILPIFLFLVWMTSCIQTGENPSTGIQHEHTYEYDWDYDEKSHWHNSTCEHKDLTEGVAEHQFGEWEPSENEKLEQRGCKVCEYVETRLKEVLEHTHTYGDWEVEKQPTLDESGKLIRVCSQDVNHIEEYTLPSLNQKNYTYTEIKEATCITKGEANYALSKDGQKFIFPIELDYGTHAFGDWELLKKPTKEAMGVLKRICNINNEHIDTFDLPKLNDIDYTYMVDLASCLENGKEVYQYEKDNQIITIEITLPSTGHFYEMKWDASKHWMGAICEHSTLKKEIADHTFEEGICTVCNYEYKEEEALLYSLNSAKDGYIASFNPEYTGNSITILDTYMDLPVVELIASSFDGKNIVSVTLPSSLQCIAADVFKDFTQLTDVYYDGAITDWCSITFKDKTSNPMHLASNFYQRGEEYWEETTELNFPSEVKIIGQYQFYGFENVEELHFPTSLIRIEEEAFANCTKIKELVIPDSVYYLGKNFLLNMKPTKLTLPFLDATNSYIGYYFGSTYRNFITGAYQHDALLSSLEELHITKASRFGYFALSNLPNLKVLTLSNTLNELGKDIIYGCDSLVYNEHKNGYYLGNEENPYLLFVKMKDSTVSDFELSSTTKLIYDKAFKDTLITEIELPTDLVDIGLEAFAGSAITAITIPDGVTKIKQKTFNGCEALEEVILPANLTNIESDAFGKTHIKRASLSLEATTILSADLEELTLLKGNGAIDLGSYPNLKKAVLTNDISSIGSGIVEKCPNLEYTVEDSIAYLGSLLNPHLWLVTALDKTIDQTSISFDTKYIYEQAYMNCTELLSVSIPSGIVYIGNEAFRNATSLSYVSYLYALSHSKLEILGNNVFKDCTSLQSLSLPNALTQVGSSILNGCSNLKSLSVPFVGKNSNPEIASSITLFGYFFGTTSYTGGTKTEQKYSDRYSSISYYIPSSLTNVEIRGGKLEYGAFYNCSMIEKITIRPEVECAATQRSYLFYNCQFREMTIPDIYIPHITRMTGTSSKYSSGLSGYIETLNITTGEEIPSMAFQYFSNLKKVDLVDSIKTIKYGAFENCSSLIDVKLPEQLETLESAAFRYCSSLKTIQLPVSLKSIGSQAFFKCSGLKYVFLPNTIETIDTEAFNSCPNLSLILEGAEVLPEWNVNITANPIYYNIKAAIELNHLIYAIGQADAQLVGYMEDNPTEITISEEVFYDGVSYPVIISQGILKDVTQLEKLTLPFIGENKNSVAAATSDSIPFGYIFGAKTVEENATAVPESLKSITLTGGNEIQIEAFLGLSHVTEIILPETLTKVGAYAFKDCSSLVSIRIPSQVITIGGRAFEKCDSLEYVILPNSISSLKNSVFLTRTNASSAAILKINIYYEGNMEEWDTIPKDSYINTMNVYLYSEIEQSGKYWHYVDDLPTIWE